MIDSNVNLVYGILGIFGLLVSAWLIFPALTELFIIERKKQLDQLHEENLHAIPFIKEHTAIVLDEEGKACTVTNYIPYYKRAVCFINGKFQYLEQNIIEDFPVTTDFTNRAQVENLLTFWSITRFINQNPKTLEVSIA